MADKKMKGLGKGFDSLIPQNFDSSILLDESERLQKIAVTDLSPNPDQPRKHFDESALDDLASSIKQHGIVQPLVVMPKGSGGYYIIAGERRWRAATKAGLKHVPAIVRSSEQLERLEVALIENVQRVDLSALEQATSIYQLHTQFSIDYELIAKRLGKAPTTISNLVRLLQLPKEAQAALQKGTITEGHARAILALKTAALQKKLLTLITEKSWTVRQAEQFVIAHKAGVTDTTKAVKRIASTTPETKKLAEVLKAPVSIKRTAKGGRLEIAFTSDEELKRLMKLFQSRLK